jgi:SAM-dependent methyltransferase
MIIDRVVEVFRDRKSRMRMSEAQYWDDRVRTRSGYARSVWHSQAFSEVWNERQTRLIDDSLEELFGGIYQRDVLDVGCGTGRVTRHLARRGARAVGVDFSAAAVEAAREEAKDVGVEARFEVGNVAAPPLPFDAQSFDVTLAVGCLAVACTDLNSLRVSFEEMARVTRPDGLILVLEPVHASKLLGRVLKAPVNKWITAASDAGLRMVRHHGMGFVPMRLALSSLDLPSWFVSPTFHAGEIAIDAFKPALRLADYSLLCFRRA